MQQTSVQAQKPVLNVLDNLNPQQRVAVTEIGCPLLIIAGAGSGKTQTVASKIVYLVEKGVKPENILALTFNQKAAEELKTRATCMLNNSEIPNISTFHSFCNQVIHENILNTKLNANFRIITETAQLVYLTKNINTFGIEHLEFNHEPYTLAEEIKKFIAKCKDENVTPHDLQTYIELYEKNFTDEEKQEEINNLKDILKIFQAYENYKLQNNMLDFGDLLCIVYNLLKNKPIILRNYQEKFQYIIVDEFQDTNYIQLQIVYLIAKHHKHITVVGDDDQSIYKFRGAYLTNIAEFKQMFPNFTQKTLEHNYRSTKKIITIANTLIENNPQRTTKKLFTNNPEGDQIDITETPNDTTQTNYILETTKKLLKKHPPQDIAILCRRKNTADPIIKAFKKHAIPYNFGTTEFFQEPIIKDITAFLKIITNPLENNAEIVRILNRHNYNIKPIDICKFNTYANQNNLCLYETFDHINKIDIDKLKFQQVKQTLTEMITTKKTQQTLELIHTILFEREFYKYELAIKHNRNIQLLNKFYTFAEEYNNIYPNNNIEDFTDYLTFASNFNLEQEQDTNKEAITISTIHSAKGMQYPIVIIPDVNERKIPTNYHKNKFNLPKELLKGIQPNYDDKELQLQEERRLFYVAITRAKDKLIMTYAKRHGENKTDSKPSRFLQEINYKQNKDINFQHENQQETTIEVTTTKNQTETKLLQQIVANLTNKQFNAAIKQILLLAKSTNKTLDVQTEIINKIKEPDYSVLERTEEKPLTIPTNHVFSVSQFVVYKKCPRQYQYHHVMKIPEKPRYYFDFGSTIHNIVEQITIMQKKGRPTNKDVVDKLLTKFWNPKGYESKIDEQRDYKEAKTILKNFLEEQSQNKAEILDIERGFETTINDVLIRGRIDRIDRYEKVFTIIDYKTSKAVASLNSLKQDMQLLVYALAVKDMYGSEIQLEVGEWFLRSNKKVFFTPEKQAIEAIQTEIQEMVKSINSGKFDPKKDVWTCRECDYKCLCD
ncbi:MAG: ATP-dependent helicase [Candidatus Bathyarchaeota archaeon]|nr:ATP-dependent helicase [Candidatus Termiticorpusculum sp.]